VSLWFAFTWKFLPDSRFPGNSEIKLAGIKTTSTAARTIEIRIEAISLANCGNILAFSTGRGYFIANERNCSIAIYARKRKACVMVSLFNERYVVDERGNPTAVILPIKDYRKMLSILEELEAYKESKILSESREFKKIVEKGLENIETGKFKPWREVWDEI
jgi:PHD/YefM family antitoxin component YafN of YafNO toxin-antitoxin module